MEDTHRGIVSATGEVVKVLILVLMEDTHRVTTMCPTQSQERVLILVLMEDTHRVDKQQSKPNNVGVLILVLMEDTHRVMSTTTKESVNGGLNPCSNGRYSQSQ